MYIGRVVVVSVSFYFEEEYISLSFEHLGANPLNGGDTRTCSRAASVTVNHDP
jgi:hypothetical protein